MQSDPHILIIWHSRTGASEAMANAVATGANGACVQCPAQEVTAQLLLAAAGYVFLCPENLASMSGAMKEMFDAHYYAALGKIEGRPYGSIIAAGSDGEGAQRQMDRIVKGWRLKRVIDPIIVNFAAQTPEEIAAQKTVPVEALQKCEDVGQAFKEGIQLGVF
ncbi:MAG: NAD(P)H-dependent oxidoreductase [Erythrobacter sp.]